MEQFGSDAGGARDDHQHPGIHATGKDSRRIYDELKDFQSRRVIDVISANRQIDGKVSVRGDGKGQLTDTDAYDLILKDKERLLSFAGPVRFVFSHSALREVWDNPNLFVMRILKKSDNTISGHQEI